MLRFALEHFRRRGVAPTNVWLRTNTVLDVVGKALGFLPMENTRYFCCKVFDPADEWLQDPRRWFITMIDAEIY